MSEHEISFHPAARVELVHAILVHEEARPGYGQRFEAAVDDVLERIRQFPAGGVLVQGCPPPLEVRCFLLDRFSYTLFASRLDGSRSIVMAVAHQHQEPDYWHERLE